VSPSPGDLIAFAGDSIVEHLVAVSDAMETQVAELPAAGANATVDRHEHRGWVELLAARLSIAVPDLGLRYLNCGRGGDTSRLLLERLERDVLVHQPRWCCLAVGVVDVRRNFQPELRNQAVSVDEYTSNLQSMTRQLREAGASVVLLEPIPHSGPPSGAPPEVSVVDVNYLTATYARGLRHVATECGAEWVELYRPFLRLETRFSDRTPPQTMYADEIHLNPLGDMHYSQLVFDALLRIWGIEATTE
jgi:lysophospholipase L1-like esterase